MTWIALKMLTGNRAKYLGITAGITLAALLIARQASTGRGLLLRTTTMIRDVADVDNLGHEPRRGMHRRTRGADRFIRLIKAEAAARASLRGIPEASYPLEFVRLEPYVIPKKSLTGDNTERVDTRVLQVIYDPDTTGRPIYVGRQMDVFINVDGDAP